MKTFRCHFQFLFSVALVAYAVKGHPKVSQAQPSESVAAGPQVPTNSAAPVPPKVVVINNAAISTNTSSAVTPPNAAAAAVGETVSSTVLVIARDNTSAYSAYSGLNAYGIPYQILLVPQTGTALPVLNSSSTSGNFGAIVILSEVSYDYGVTGFQSALTSVQWASLFAYQTSFGVRMVRLDVFPSADSGTTAIGGCCGTGVEQLLSISNNTAFPTAGLISYASFCPSTHILLDHLTINSGAGVSTVGLWHYPATILNASIATEIAQFAPTTGFSTTSTAGVINNIAGRQQMVFFTSFATDWSPTSNFLQHAWIHWATRGLCRF